MTKPTDDNEISDAVERRRTRDGIRYFVRIRLQNGERRRFPLPLGISETKAKDMARAMRQRVRGNPDKYVIQPNRRQAAKVRATAAQTGGDQWWASYLEWRARKGRSPVADVYRAHIKPVLGDKHPRHWTRQDAEALVTALDQKIEAGAWQGERQVYKFGWKRAQNVWSLFTSACKTACSAKAATGLRCRDDYICSGVEGPDRGDDKQKQWLFPSEFEKLISCEQVPLRWRRFYVLLAYLYVRASELKVLEWSDVSFESGTVHITKAWDEKEKDPAKKIGPPKSKAGVRFVPIEPTLRPLLEALHERAKGKKAKAEGRVIVIPPMEQWAGTLRRHLKRAGVDRAVLFDDTETTKQITLHDLRSTGITWRCLRGDNAKKIQQDAGHEKGDTTDKYIRTASVFGANLGEVFRALPSALIDVANDAATPDDLGHVLAHVVPKNAKSKMKASVPSGIRMRSDSADLQDSAGLADHESTKSDIIADCNSAMSRPGPGSPDAVEAALADAVTGAVAAGQWDAVKALVAELEARRKARAAVVDLDAERAKRGR